MFDVPFKLHIYHDFNGRIFVDTSVILIVVCSSAATRKQHSIRLFVRRVSKFVSN